MAENHLESMIARGGVDYQANFQTNTETFRKKGTKAEQPLFTFLMDIVNTNFAEIANRLEETISEKSLIDFWNEQKTLSKLLQPPIRDYSIYLIEKTCSSESDIIRGMIYDCLFRIGYMHIRSETGKKIVESKESKDFYITHIRDYLQELNLPHDFIELIMYEPTYRQLSDYYIFTNKIVGMCYDSLYPIPYNTNWQTLDNAIDCFVEYKKSSNDEIVGDNLALVSSLPFACLELLIAHNEFNIHKCGNCGKYFVDLSPDEKFCNNKAPQSSSETCRELCHK